MSRNALVVDTGSMRGTCAEILQTLGFEVRVANSAEGALAILESAQIDIVLADVRAPGASGVELLKGIKRKSPATDVVMMADSGSIPEAVEAIKLGAYDYISNIGKPFKADDLRHLLQRLVEKQRLASENRLLREEVSTLQGFGRLIGASEAMQAIYRLILKIAGKRHPVLVLGESGTGKELVAHAIHAYSPWHDRPFVPIDCGALPPTLIESELFGHVRGAFTGADATRVGLLASAGSGTVFLDEVGELQVGLQVKLLRALQEREFKAIGANTPTRLEARIVAATNRELEAAIKEGTFRKDLYYRLNVVTIKTPPLRGRKGDIPALVHSFLERYRGEDGEVREISSEALSRLMSYNWPGNVRELENCIQHALALASGSEIGLSDLPAHLLNEAGKDSVPEQEVTSLQQLERRAIVQALQETGGDRLRAAKLLGIGKTTIYRKLKEYGLEDSTEVPPPA
jgi:two-component system response regulator AtoC